MQTMPVTRQDRPAGPNNKVRAASNGDPWQCWAMTSGGGYGSAYKTGRIKLQQKLRCNNNDNNNAYKIKKSDYAYGHTHTPTTRQRHTPMWFQVVPIL